VCAEKAERPSGDQVSSRILAHVRTNVVGYVALTFALTGVAWAAHTAPKNSVVTKSIKRGAVTNPKLAAGAVTGDKVAPGSLTPAAFAPGSVGTITGVSAGSGLNGGGNSGNVTLSADESVLQHRLDGGCQSGQAIQSVGPTGASTCRPFFGGTGKAVLLDNALTSATSPVTIADFGFVSIEATCSDTGPNQGTMQLDAKVPAGGQPLLSYSDNGSSSVIPAVLDPNVPTGLAHEVTNNFAKVSFSIGNGGFPGAGVGDVSGTVYINGSFQNSTATCNDLGFVLGS
jgi:hypothetical protein